MIMFYVPCKDKKEAREISKALIEQKLIACSNIAPIKSMYFWDDKMCDESEQVMIAKTTDEKEETAREAIKNLHSYKIPSVISWKVNSNKDYDDWVKSEVQ